MIAVFCLTGLAVPAFVAAASERAQLTVTCKTVSATVCTVSEPITAADNNQQLVVLLPGKYLGVTLNLSTHNSGVSFGDPHTLSSTKWVTTLFVPTTVPAGTRALLTFRVAPGTTRPSTTTSTTGTRRSVKAGRYRGKSAQGEPVSFTVSASRKTITGFTTFLDDGNCGQVGGPGYLIKAPPIAVAANGSFKATVKGSVYGLPTVEIRVSGSLSVTGARGTLARLAAQCPGPNKAATSSFTAQSP